jgi:3',5'-cyclic AMP phosphodiesterase CpdA
MKNQKLTRRSFLKLGGATAASLTIFSRNSWAAASPNTGVAVSTTYPETSSELRIKDTSRFKLLQLTDSHFFQVRKDGPDEYLLKAGVTNRDARTMDDWKRLVDLCQPDLVAHTGDMWHNNPEGRGAEYQQAGVERLDSLGVPWICVWGNHDELDDVPKGHDRFHDGKQSLYRGGPGGGNYTVNVVGPDGKPAWKLICMNTNKNGLVEESLGWLTKFADEREQKAYATPSFAVHHIPTKAYITAMTNGTCSGVLLEPVSHEKETGAAFDQLRRIKSLRACFCGHDHISDISGTVDGVELIFGRSSGWSGYGWEKVRKGGKLYTVNCQAATYAWESIFSDGFRWQPEKGKRINEVLDEPFMQDPLKKQVKAA